MLDYYILEVIKSCGLDCANWDESVQRELAEKIAAKLWEEGYSADQGQWED